MWSNWNPHKLLVVMKNRTANLEKQLTVPYKVKCHTMEHLGIYPRKVKTYACTQSCMLMIIAALFISPKAINNPNNHHLVNG